MSWSPDPPDPPDDDGPVIDPRIRERREEIQRSQGRRRLRWVLAVAVALSLAVVIVLVLHSPQFSARVITVTGPHSHTSSAAIVAAAGLGHHPPLISTDPGTAASKVEALPFIATAEVHRHWPDGVEIAVTERVAVVQMVGPGASWSTLDGYGRTLQVQPSRSPGPIVFTVRSSKGEVRPAGVGGTLPPRAGAGLKVCRTLPPAFSAQVVSVAVARDGTISMVLSSGITVLLGTATDLATKYEDVAAIIAHGSLHSTSSIDVTVPQSPTVSG